MTNQVLRWSRVTIAGSCLQPELKDQQIVDGLVDFDFEKIEIGSFIVYKEGGRPKVKKVLGFAGQTWEMRDSHILIGQYVLSLNERQQVRLNGYNETVPDNCVLVGSNESPDRFIMIVHRDNITHHIPLSEVPT